MVPTWSAVNYSLLSKLSRLHACTVFASHGPIGGIINLACGPQGKIEGGPEFKSNLKEEGSAPSPHLKTWFSLAQNTWDKHESCKRRELCEEGSSCTFSSWKL